MKKVTLIVLLVLGLFTIQLQAQRNCGTMEHLEYLQEQYPEIIQNMQQIEEQTQQFLQNEIQFREVVTIPVVVHVVYKTNGQNISDDQIQSQIDVLNEDFRRTNTDSGNTPSVFTGVAADTEIQFCLASVDPNGNATNGIVRKQTNKPSFSSNDGVKKSSRGGSDAWPASDYLNIWVCNLNGLLGYAQFPGGPASTDGVVCNYQAFGRGNQYTLYSSYNLGRTATHEVGHWLNLRHIWGDGGCSVDDFVADTPLAGAPNYTGIPCTFPGPNTCNTGGGDLPDMFQNYMDYSDDACMNLYTTGQKDRMQALFGPGGSKASLLSSNGCENGNASEICDNGIDDDGDGLTDCDDPDCASASNCQTGPEICDNGIDDDGDGLADCDDPDCASAVNCQTGGTCNPPTGLATTGIKRKRANVSWGAVLNATSYTVRYRVVGSSSWTTVAVSGTSTSLGGLSNATTYEWQVRSECGGSSSTYSTTCTFTAGSSNSASCNSSREFTQQLKVYPNPAQDMVVVELATFNREQTLYITDLHGRILQQYQLSGEEGTMELNVSQLTSGLYFVRIIDAEGISLGTSKLLIQK